MSKLELSSKMINLTPFLFSDCTFEIRTWILLVSEISWLIKDVKEKFNYVFWNHSLSEVMTSLLNLGLTINHFNEYNYSPYDCFSHTQKIEEHKYRIKPFGDKMPLCYSLTANK